MNKKDLNGAGLGVIMDYLIELPTAKRREIIELLLKEEDWERRQENYSR